MNKRHITALATFFLMSATAAAAGSYSAAEKIREVPNGQVEVEIWTDRGEGSRYCAGDEIEIYFRTNVDAWVAIYDIDTRGEVHRLFPSRHHRHNFVRGGEVHRVPASRGFHFEVEGPTGWETLRAVASTDRYALTHGVFDRTPTLRPKALPTSNRGAFPNKIREVPDHRPPAPNVAVAEARHFVRDGFRCRVPRPWWYR